MPATPDLTVILVLDHAAINGGLAKVAIDSALGLKRAGATPIVFAAAGPVDARLSAAGIETHCLGQHDLLGNPSKLAGAAQGLWNFRAARALGAVLAGRDPTRAIVHVHGWAKALSASIARPIAASGLKSVFTFHDYFLLCPNGGFYNYQAQHVCALRPMSAACWKTHCDSINYARKLWRCARHRLMTNVARFPEIFDAYILISKFQEKIVAPYLFDARVFALGNPIDCVDLGEKPDPASGDFLFLGRLSLEKGVFLLAEAARKAGVTPVFAGDGPAAAPLREKFPECRLLGWQNPSQVQSLLRTARVKIFPSLWYEGQPLSVLEAKSFGTPVIVSDGCSGRESIIDGVEGLWFKGGDVDALAAALERAKIDATIAAWSRAAYQNFWADPPTLARHVKGLLHIYDEVLASQRRRAASIPQTAPSDT